MSWVHHCGEKSWGNIIRTRQTSESVAMRKKRGNSFHHFDSVLQSVNASWQTSFDWHIVLVCCWEKRSLWWGGGGFNDNRPQAMADAWPSLMCNCCQPFQGTAGFREEALQLSLDGWTALMRWTRFCGLKAFSPKFQPFPIRCVAISNLLTVTGVSPYRGSVLRWGGGLRGLKKWVLIRQKGSNFYFLLRTECRVEVFFRCRVRTEHLRLWFEYMRCHLRRVNLALGCGLQVCIFGELLTNVRSSQSSSAASSSSCNCVPNTLYHMLFFSLLLFGPFLHFTHILKIPHESICYFDLWKQEVFLSHWGRTKRRPRLWACSGCNSAINTQTAINRIVLEK